jgi:RHS repeat-associated protein
LGSELHDDKCQRKGFDSAVNPLQYTGREWDQETGLYYYRARYYDPSTGRFLSEDPIRFNAGINFFSYSANRPTVFTDSTGLKIDPLGNILGRNLSDCVKEVLKQYFPQLNLDKIRIHRDDSLQWFGIQAITHGNHIYYDVNAVDGTVNGLANLAHELVHSTQYGKAGGLIPFYVNYLTDYFHNFNSGQNSDQAYQNIPAETEAFSKENEIHNDLIKRFGVLGQPCKEICK